MSCSLIFVATGTVIASGQPVVTPRFVTWKRRLSLQAGSQRHYPTKSLFMAFPWAQPSPCLRLHAAMLSPSLQTAPSHLQTSFYDDWSNITLLQNSVNCVR